MSAWRMKFALVLIVAICLAEIASAQTERQCLAACSSARKMRVGKNRVNSAG